MCNSPLHQFLVDLPKCEHHVHIEGTMSAKLLFELAEKNSVTLPKDDPAFKSSESLESRYENWKNLDDFLHYFFIGFSVLITESDFELLTYDHLQNVYGQGVRHTEIFFDPQMHIERGISYATVIAGMTRGRQRAMEEFGNLTVEFIPCLVRHLPVPSALSMLDEVVKAGHFADGTVLGFGMSSTEKGMHPSLFAPVYDAAKQASITNLTAHCGEEGPAAYVRDGISQLGITRVDHGRRAVEDDELIEQLARDGTMLTLCPWSNLVLQGIEKIEDLPVRRFLDAGVRFSINSDDPGYQGGDLLRSFCAVQEAFDLSVDEWVTISENAISGSWCSDDRKNSLRAGLKDVVDAWGKA
ncbi:hypothetical protein N3K66_009014 [Trichothecium roseum]|uniref:Uncharacterized protein n=1 Tax=Trichothecium roseum TaxID=47278 RepID=A0ACC0URI0_9HYPO|nr:hypothetical protein N3K66_009014 [Trichothecium roseum]